MFRSFMFYIYSLDTISTNSSFKLKLFFLPFQYPKNKNCVSLILLLITGKPWLLIVALVAYIVAFARIGCLSQH